MYNLPQPVRVLLNAGGCLLVCAYLIAISPILRSDADFYVYYQAAIRLSEGRDLYQSSLYTYGPIFAWLLLPLSSLSPMLARYCWFALQIASLLVFIWLSIRISGLQLARRYWGLIMLVSFLMVPTYLDLVLGQIGAVMALLTVAGYSAVRRRTFWPGWWLGLAITIKLYPGFLGLAYLRRRQWFMLANITVSSCVLLGLTVWACGWQSLVSFLSHILHRSDYPYASEHIISLYGFWLRVFTINHFVAPLVVSPWAASIATALSSAALLYVCLRQGPPASELDDLVQFSIWLCALLLIFPASGVYSLMLIVFPMLVAMRVYEEHKYPFVLQWILVIIMLLYIPPVSSLIGITQLQHQYGALLYFTPTIYAVLALLTLLLVAQRRLQNSLPDSK